MPFGIGGRRQENGRAPDRNPGPQRRVRIFILTTSSRRVRCKSGRHVRARPGISTVLEAGIKLTERPSCSANATSLSPKFVRCSLVAPRNAPSDLPKADSPSHGNSLNLFLKSSCKHFRVKPSEAFARHMHISFDRMLVCQAIQHELTLLTPDPLITQYAFVAPVIAYGCRRYNGPAKCVDSTKKKLSSAAVLKMPMPQASATRLSRTAQPGRGSG